MVKKQRYVAFYFVEGFWAGQKPDYLRFGSDYWIAPEYRALMEEQVLQVKEGNRQVIVCRDGMMMYSDDALQELPETAEGVPFKRIEDYLDLLNALFCVVVSKITEIRKVKQFDFFALTHQDMIPVMFEDGKFSGIAIPQKSIQRPQLNNRFLSYIPAGYIDSLDLYLDSPPRPVIEVDVLKETIEFFFELTKDQKMVRLLARSNKAVAEYEGASYSDSLLLAWTQTEVYLYDELQSFAVAAGSTRFNSKRRNYLEKKITVSNAIEILEATGTITIEEYEELNLVRGVRNRIIHNSASATFEEAGQALAVLEQVIKKKTGRALRLNTGGPRMQLF